MNLKSENQVAQTINQQTEIIRTACIYMTVTQFCESYPAFKNGGIRGLIFHENSNGLAKSGAIVRMGRKVLIRPDRFFSWMESGQKKQATGGK
jgi:hypothetical protein